jgi:hypothetical protein
MYVLGSAGSKTGDGNKPKIHPIKSQVVPPHGYPGRFLSVTPGSSPVDAASY